MVGILSHRYHIRKPPSGSLNFLVVMVTGKGGSGVACLSVFFAYCLSIVAAVLGRSEAMLSLRSLTRSFIIDVAFAILDLASILHSALKNAARCVSTVRTRGLRRMCGEPLQLSRLYK